MNQQKSAETAEQERQPQRTWRILPLLLIGALFVVGSSLILLLPTLSARQPYNLQVGDIAPEDIHAPREINYVSQIETQSARDAAAARVADIYDPPDARITRQQVLRARQIMDFIRDVRADTFASPELKLSYLDQIIFLNLSPEVSSALLSLSDEQYSRLEDELVSLVAKAMSGTVREGQVADVTSRLELQVSTDLPEPLIPLAVAIARQLVVPNSILNVAATETARQQAAAAVPEIRQTFQPGEIIIRAGEPVDELDLEALVALGLASRRLSWQEVASSALASLLGGIVLAIYLRSLQTQWLEKPKQVLILVILFLLFLLGAEAMIPAQPVLAYLFPVAALSLALTALVGVEFAALVTIVLAAMIGLLSGGMFQVVAYMALSGLLAAGSLPRGARLNEFFRAGLFAAVGGAAVQLIFWLPNQLDSFRLLMLLTISVLNGLLSAGVALVILFVVGNLTDMTTSLQLLDLMRPDHPLQRKLQQEAIGTYHHTLSVANLVEAAAEAIGADPLLARVGTLYHDIGKSANPGFFVENRTEGGHDPHEGLSPLTSARIIKAHVNDGLELARKYRLPPSVTAFIAEHHGRLPILFFLSRAREEAAAAGATLDEREFYYDGPTPHSRETAILMLADGCESAARSQRPTNGNDIEEIVERIFKQRMDTHQLDESGLTLTDLKIIKETFIHTLKGMYHPRVAYPSGQLPAQKAVELEEVIGEGEPVPGGGMGKS
jgi:putative nucleotidyltransferase with HDIG domain